MKEYYGRYDGLTLQISPWECYCKHKENYYNGKGQKIRYTKEENNNVMSRYDHKIETSLEGIGEDMRL